MSTKKNNKQTDIEETAIVKEDVVLPGLDLSAVGKQDYGQEHSAHLAKVTAEELIVPTLRIVQDSSTIYKEKSEDADIEIGDIYSTTSGQVWKGTQGVLLVPLMCSACVVKRTPSPEGKFVSKMSLGDPEVVEARGRNGGEWARLENRKRETLNYTDEVVCSLIDPSDGVTPIGLVVVPFHGTNVWPRKQWWNRMAEVPSTPWYAFRVLLKTEIRHGKAKDSYKYKAEAYGGNWHICRFPVGHPVLDDFKGLLDEYLRGDHGTTSYEDADAGPTETEKEEAAF